ncbi:sensor histidine kinase [Roseimaritima ulvae]|uniref:histidine kinase n=1 Tax=Roseimaritima ulvae TaxID=980254 RepID=A0A5B9R8S5_9BACT|nr:HAMP domain-containing sensor histidine kinase [Roseimaritima ulvae]QEG43271.1 Sensor histidine kinase TmoS [Roseimaritima ulvae]
MTFLPCLRWSQSRWWLPLEPTTADSLAAVLLDPTDNAASARHVAAIEQRLQRDPALLMYAVLRRAEQSRRSPPKRYSLPRLSRWLVRQAPRLFAQPDRQLDAPTITAEDRQQWRLLTERCQALPIEQWMDSAPRWLAIHGPRVPARWRATWPQLRPPTEPLQRPALSLRYGDGTLPLSRLASVVRSERQLRTAFDHRLQTAKLASLKQFAYGLTHEINNPLANIVTRSEQLQADESDAKRHASLQRVIAQAMRAHEMISDVMFFAHPPQPNLGTVDVGGLVDEVMSAYRRRCEELDIELCLAQASAAAGSRELSCVGDAAMVHDAIDALLRNAVEAVGSAGRIVIDSGRRGDKVWVRVADSGPGLSEQAQRHAFDPYYSGREAGRGLGLGLCRVYRIAKLHHGGATLRSGPAGCTARFWLRD